MAAKPYGNQPTAPPDLEGMGRAWRVEAPDAAAHQKDADCGSWLVHAPHGHLWWPWYVVSAVHLRPLDEQPPPHIRFPGATHELLVVALNPEEPLPDVKRWGAEGTPPVRFLTPIDQCVQFVVANDEQAREMCDLVVRHILGGASPDQDHRAYWEGVVGRTAEHIRLGGHPDQDEAA